MHSSESKLFMEVAGLTVIERTLSPFISFAKESGLKLHGIIVTTEDMIPTMKELTGDDAFPFIERIIPGGTSRTESVKKGVLELASLENPPKKDSPVFIHDAARCLVTPDVLMNCINTLTDCEVCVAAVPAKNTIKKIKPDSKDTPIIESTPDRQYLYEAQTPQCFRYNTLLKCYDNSKLSKMEVTDDVSIAENMGIEVRIAEGSYSNIKITTPEDINLAEVIIKSN